MPESDRTVVFFQPTSDKSRDVYFSLTAPKTPAAAMLQLFSIDPEKDPFCELPSETPQGAPYVRDFGQQLYDVLNTHPAVRMRLAEIFASEKTQPIYFHVGSILDDALPWETLYCDQKEFVAFDSQFPIANLYDVNLRGSRASAYTFTPPLTIMLILSGPPAKNPDEPSASLIEWQGLWARLATDFGLPLKIRVVTSDEQVLRTIGQLDLEWVTADPIVDLSTLMLAIKQFRPRLLHFYCPCSAPGTLDIPTKSDWSALVQGKSGCSISFSARLLREKADNIQAIWAVTLNCFTISVVPDGEKHLASRAPRKFARELIRNAFPIAVTTREPVDASQARCTFSQFYMDAIVMIADVPLDGKPNEIEWSANLLLSRSNLIKHQHEGDSPELRESCRHWTIPVLFASPEPFLIKRPAPGSEVALHDASHDRTTTTLLERLKSFGLDSDPDAQAFLDFLAARRAGS